MPSVHLCNARCWSHTACSGRGAKVSREASDYHEVVHHAVLPLGFSCYPGNTVLPFILFSACREKERNLWLTPTPARAAPAQVAQPVLCSTTHSSCLLQSTSQPLCSQGAHQICSLSPQCLGLTAGNPLTHSLPPSNRNTKARLIIRSSQRSSSKADARLPAKCGNGRIEVPS